MSQPFYKEPFNISTAPWYFDNTDSDSTIINVLAKWLILIGFLLSILRGQWQPLFMVAVGLIVLAFFFAYKIRAFDRLPTIIDFNGSQKSNKAFSKERLSHESYNAIRDKVTMYNPDHPNTLDENRTLLKYQIRKKCNNDDSHRRKVFTKNVGKRIRKPDRVW